MIQDDSKRYSCPLCERSGHFNNEQLTIFVEHIARIIHES